MKKLLLLFFVALPLFVCAQSSDYNIIVNRTNAPTIRYGLSEKPVITFSATSLCISTASTFVEIPKNELIGWKFENDSSTKLYFVPISMELIWIDANTLTIRGLKAQDDVRVFSVQGVDVTFKTLSKNGDETRVSVANMPTGVYLLNINQYHITKIIRK